VKLWRPWTMAPEDNQRVIVVTASMIASLLMGRSVVAGTAILMPAADLFEMPDRRDLAVKRFGGIEDAWLES
jgi:hypothetical protein